MRRTYLDHNATSPLDPRVAEVMARVARDFPGNAESQHAAGREARARLEEARETVATFIGASPREIVFTSGGTESDNLAVLGAARMRTGRHPRVVVSAGEHPAVLGPAERLERKGWQVVRLPLDDEGRPDPSEFARAIADGAALASVMLANNETGALFPVAAMAALARERNVPFHTDAVQAIGRVPVSVASLGVDLLSGSAHKAGGPPGIGFLYVRTGVGLEPLLAGGPQERALRPGTAPVALAAGLAAALEIARREGAARAASQAVLVERLFARLSSDVPGLRRNGPAGDRLPNTLSFEVPGVPGEAMLIALDRLGFCVSTGSACASGAALPSHVLLAMGRTREEARASLRVSLGAGNDEGEIDRFAEAVGNVAGRLRDTC